jgi:hypothetical protein
MISFAPRESMISSAPQRYMIALARGDTWYPRLRGYMIFLAPGNTWYLWLQGIHDIVGSGEIHDILGSCGYMVTSAPGIHYIFSSR